jgi:hypothetical protein
VLFHLGVLPRPPADPRRRPGLGGHYSGVAEPLRGLLLGYCAQAAATRAPATVKAIASHLAGFGRFLTACDPPVTDLAALDRRAHIEPWLALLAAVMALAGSAQRCLSKLLSSGRGEAARVGGAGQALGPLTRRGCWSSVDHVPPDITR